MPSSTSSSDVGVRLPVGGWGLTWAVAAVLTILVGGAYEVFGRSRGFVPLVNDDIELWCTQREHVTRRGRNVIALVGSSRMLTGSMPRVLEQELPGYEVVQLAVAGKQPFAVLKDLAADKDFKGIVICEIFPMSILPAVRPSMDDYVRFYHSSWTTEKRVKRSLSTLIEARLVLWSPQRPRLSLRDLPGAVRDFLTHGRAALPSSSYGRTILADRTSLLDFQRADPAAARRNSIKSWNDYKRQYYQPVSPSQWLGYIAEMDDLVNQIQSRSGQVVIIDYPLNGELRELYDGGYPPAQFWDVLSERSKAIVISSAGTPALSRFVCPDDMHLDRRQVADFTKCLASELRRRQAVR